MVKTKTTDIGGSMLIHTFGAYFGLACSRTFMHADEAKESERNNKPTKTSDLFAMIGTIYLFIFWPSFNCALAFEANARHRTVMNTCYSISMSCVVTYLLSKIFNKRISLIKIIYIRWEIKFSGHSKCYISWRSGNWSKC